MSSSIVIGGPRSGYEGARPPADAWLGAGDAIAARDVRASRIFLHIGFLTCLILQRFGYLSGTMALFLATPVFLGLLAWLLVTGRARFRANISIPFIAFLASAAVTTMVALAFPDNRVGISLTSPLAIVLNYIVFIVAPSPRFDTTQGLDIFVFYSRFIAIAGILQYAVQFIGLSIFSWMVSFPALTPILVEDAYNNLPTTSWRSSTMRSNGFFMLEPSIFSQLLVVAICVEFFLIRRWKFLPVYAIAYALSYSGTGLLCLVLSLPLYLVIFYREAGRVVGFGLAALAIAAAAYIALPDVVDQLASRSSEFDSSGSSGYKRYIGQFESVDVVLNEARLIIGYGPGATDRATFFIEGSGGTIQKLMIDYGVIGLVAFFSFLLPAIWRRDLAIVPLVMFMIFLFGGGKMFAAYSTMLMALLCIWTARPSHQPPQADPATI